MVLQALNAAGHLTVAAAERPTTTESDRQDLRDALPGAVVLTAPLGAGSGRSVVAKLLRSVRGVATLTPPWLYRTWSPTLASQIDGFSADEFDVIVLVGENSGPYARRLVGPVVVWDKSNILVESEFRTLVDPGSFSARLRALLTVGLTWRFERRVVARAATIWVSSIEESDRLGRWFSRKADAVIPSSISVDSEVVELDTEARVAVWMSTLSYRPNWDGLLSFLEANAVALADAGWRLRVVGAGASTGRERLLRAHPFVDYVGYADDLRDAFAGSSCAVVPLWHGAGVKLKTLTFLGLGVPVVSTPIGLEGITREAAVRVVDSAGEFTAALTTLTTAELHSAAARGRAIVTRDFSRESFDHLVLEEVRRLATTDFVRRVP
jgi:hypothetical protein